MTCQASQGGKVSMRWSRAETQGGGEEEEERKKGGRAQKPAALETSLWTEDWAKPSRFKMSEGGFAGAPRHCKQQGMCPSTYTKYISYRVLF